MKQKGLYMSDSHYTTISDDIRRNILKGDAIGLAVYLEIKSRIGANSHTWASVRTIADSTGLNLTTVERALTRLKKLNLIRTEKKPGRVNYTYLCGDSDCMRKEYTSAKTVCGKNTGVCGKNTGVCGKNTKVYSVKYPQISTKEINKEKSSTNEKITVRDYSPSPKITQWAKKTYPNLDLKNVFWDFQAWNSGSTSYDIWEKMFTGYVKKIAILAKIPMRTDV
jgi:hypothetical protein